MKQASNSLRNFKDEIQLQVVFRFFPCDISGPDKKSNHIASITLFFRKK